MLNGCLFVLIGFFIFSCATEPELCATRFRSRNIGCEDRARSNSSAASYPLLFDSINLNASSVPTFKSPVGVEVFYGGNKVNFATVKGFDGFGLGFNARLSEQTFFSTFENYKVGRNGSVDTSDLEPILNSAITFELFRSDKLINVPIGLNFRYNADREHLTLNPGISINGRFFNVGLSFYGENYDERTNSFGTTINERQGVLIINLGLKLWSLLFDYTFTGQRRTENRSYGGVSTSTEYKVGTHIMTLTLALKNINFTAARRHQTSSRSTQSSTGLSSRDNPNDFIDDGHFLAGINYQTATWGVGAYHNYVIEEDITLLFQLFF